MDVENQLISPGGAGRERRQLDAVGRTDLVEDGLESNDRPASTRCWRRARSGVHQSEFESPPQTRPWPPRLACALGERRASMPVQLCEARVSLIDVLDRVLDKGIVIDAWVRVSLAGVDLVTLEARILVASFETYLTQADAVGRSPAIACWRHPERKP
jgi:gas vesicle structural protein